MSNNDSEILKNNNNNKQVSNNQPSQRAQNPRVNELKDFLNRYKRRVHKPIIVFFILHIIAFLLLVITAALVSAGIVKAGSSGRGSGVAESFNRSVIAGISGGSLSLVSFVLFGIISFAFVILFIMGAFYTANKKVDGLMGSMILFIIAIFFPFLGSILGLISSILAKKNIERQIAELEGNLSAL
ncbi:hypothetical protein MGF_3158 [Mycoplasmoides gallisepticum str. F]|uniref:hypothetical protein n=1 Tax=Mycoplasmoides gallisepticum TaxID=2096 RepID=UPI0001C39AEA|nr:hypothetical protein [Mycoplasmoides gallisepticum]ADC31365.1 hypothetical protein MGF_3158 [Mycoplasmoides gallisepticum str. F]